MSLREDPYLLTVADQFGPERNDAIRGAHTTCHFDGTAERLADRDLLRHRERFSPAVLEPKDSEAPGVLGCLHDGAQRDDERRTSRGDRTERDRANHAGPNRMRWIWHGDLDWKYVRLRIGLRRNRRHDTRNRIGHRVERDVEVSSLAHHHQRGIGHREDRLHDIDVYDNEPDRRVADQRTALDRAGGEETAKWGSHGGIVEGQCRLAEGVLSRSD